MGAIAGQRAARPGVAPGAIFISSATGGATGPSESQDYRVIDAIETAVIYAPYADVINLSTVQDTGQNGNISGDGAQALEAYVDQLVDLDLRHVVASGGNDDDGAGGISQCNNDGDRVQSPGSAYNAMTVGGYNDKNTPGISDDVIWYDGRIVDRSYGSFWKETFNGLFDAGQYLAPGPIYRGIIPGNQRVRWAVSWNAHASYNVGTDAYSSSRLATDFDVLVQNKATGALVASSTRDSSNVEVADWVGQAGVTYRIEMRPVRWTSTRGSETLGWAYVWYP